MRHPILLPISLVILCALAAQADPVVLQHITDIPQQWSPGHELYIKGEIPLRENELLHLDSFLKQHPHWTVVLADTAKGETYQTTDGLVVHGNQAVADVMGKGLSLTDEGKLTDPTTHLADGASLWIQIKDHHLDYAAGAEQNHYGVGGAQWKGNLDQRAIQDLRNGMQVLPAVEDTITLIDQKVAQGIASEKQDFDSSAITSQDKLGEVKADVATFQQNHPDAVGSLYHPNLENYQSEISTATQQHDSGQLNQINRELDKVEGDLATFAKDQATYTHLANHKPADTAALERAHNELLQGDLPSAEQHFQSIQQAVDQNSQNEDVAITLGVLGLFLFLGIAFLISVGVLIKMWFVHSKRKQYLEKLSTWNAALVAKTDGLFDLDKRLESLALMPPDLIGSARKLYTGITLEQVLRALKTKDQLYIMSSYLHDLYDKARAEVDKHPLGNWLFDKHYKKALNLLKSEPIRFQHNDPLRTLTQGDQKIDGLLGRPEDYAEFTATADELFDKFGALAKPTLKVIETIQEASGLIQSKVAQSRRDEQELKGLPITPIDEAEMSRQALQDPIGALNFIENHQQQMNLLKEARAVLQAAKDARLAHLPEPQQKELIQKRDEAEAQLNIGEGGKARDMLKVFERKREIYQQEWQKAQDFARNQPVLHSQLQSGVALHQDQPWAPAASVATVNTLLAQANGYAQAQEIEKSQQIYNQVSTIQSDWAAKQQEYLRAQAELERLRLQTQQGGVGMQQYQEAQQHFYQGDYSNTLVYTALAFQAMEDVRLEMLQAEQMRQEQARDDAPIFPPIYNDNNNNNDSWTSGSSSDSSSSGSDWTSSDSGSSSSDSGSSGGGSDW